MKASILVSSLLERCYPPFCLQHKPRSDSVRNSWTETILCSYIELVRILKDHFVQITVFCKYYCLTCRISKSFIIMILLSAVLSASASLALSKLKGAAGLPLRGLSLRLAPNFSLGLQLCLCVFALNEYFCSPNTREMIKDGLQSEACNLSFLVSVI